MKKKKIKDYSKIALRQAPIYSGKVQTVPKVPVTSLNDFSIWYTPGVAEVSLAVSRNHDLSFEYTNRWNTLCILTDGSRVLGLGDIGPEASLPVMEGKALIYKYLGGVDAIPIPCKTGDPKEIVKLACLVEPGFGAIHLEDIASPKCFEILDSLKKILSIPVWHDDQQGTAGVILAGLINSFEVIERPMRDSRIVLMGAGAANIAAARLLISAGVPAANLIVVDSKGIIHPERADIDKMLLENKWKYDLALITNGDRLKGDLEAAANGSDALVAASKPGPNTIARRVLEKMKKNSILFALSNPVPEIWPEEARKAGVRVIATGRSDFPNQVNNSLIFPSVIRGVMDVRAKSIPDEVIIAGANELAKFARTKGRISENRILPTMMDFDLYPVVAAAVGRKCIEMSIARSSKTKRELVRMASQTISKSRKIAQSLVEKGLIRPMKENI